MQFLNTEIDPATLPAMEELELRPVSRDYLTILRIEWLITAVILAIIAAGLILFIPETRTNYIWLWIVAGYLLLMTLYLLTQEKSFPYRAYGVREHDIIYRSGWIIRTTRICPLNRVLNCSMHAGPLERKYGLSTLALFTAGSTGADMRIAGLQAEEAEAIRKFVLTRINEESTDN